MGVTIVGDIRDVPNNPKGIVALTTEMNNILLAYPVSDSSGVVAVFDLNKHKVSLLFFQRLT